MKIVCRYSLGIHPESSFSQFSVFTAYSSRDLMYAELLVEIKRYIAKPFLFLEFPTVHVALCPYPCRTELSVFGRAIQVRAEGGYTPVLIEIVAQLYVCVKVQILGVVFLFKQYARWVDMRCRFVFQPVSMLVSTCRESWVLACCGIEQHLRIKDVMVLE